MSTGLATLASAGRISRSRSAVYSPVGGSSRPAASQASAARMPSPPALVSSAARRPRGAGWLESSAATSTSSSSVAARITPAWWKSASTAASEPASAAVWELAARAPAAVVPLLSASTGFERAMRCAIRPKRRGLPNDSTYIRTTSVAASSSHHSRRSFVETSALLPIETNAERPRPRCPAASRSTSPSAPLCDEKPMLPGGTLRPAKVAFSATRAEEMPRQFGPMSRPPCPRTSSSSARSRSAPSLPTSAKPAEMTTSARIPRRSARAVAAEARYRLAAQVDGIDHAAEVALDDVPEEAAADRLGPPRGADDRDAARLEERRQRCGNAHVVALIDRRAVERGRADGELDLDRAALEMAGHAEADVLEDAEHLRVLRQHHGEEPLDACGRRAGGELLQQPGSEAAPLDVVRDCEGGLGRGGVAQPHVRRARHDPPVEHAHERAPRVPVGLEHRLDERRRDRDAAMEAIATRLLREVAEEGDEAVEVGASGRTQPQGRPVAQDDVGGLSLHGLDHGPSVAEAAGAAIRTGHDPPAAFPQLVLPPPEPQANAAEGALAAGELMRPGMQSTTGRTIRRAAPRRPRVTTRANRRRDRVSPPTTELRAGESGEGGGTRGNHGFPRGANGSSNRAGPRPSAARPGRGRRSRTSGSRRDRGPPPGSGRRTPHRRPRGRGTSGRRAARARDACRRTGRRCRRSCRRRGSRHPGSARPRRRRSARARSGPPSAGAPRTGRRSR